MRNDRKLVLSLSLWYSFAKEEEILLISIPICNVQSEILRFELWLRTARCIWVLPNAFADKPSKYHCFLILEACIHIVKELFRELFFCFYLIYVGLTHLSVSSVIGLLIKVWPKNNSLWEFCYINKDL